MPPETAIVPWGPAGASGAWNNEADGRCRFSNLGVHLLRLHALADRSGTDGTFVDLGVDHGVSSLALAVDAIPRRNTVIGVDLSFAKLGYDLRAHPNYHRVRGDSVTVGRRWDRGPIDLLVVDTLHVAPHVLGELYHWVPHVRPGGTIVVHDTAWPDDRHDLDWHPRASASGPPGGRAWPTPDRAVASFFGLDDPFATGKHTGFHHEDDDVEVTHHPDSWGMTIIRLQPACTPRDLRANVDDWSTVFAERAEVLRSLMDERTLRWFDIDLDPPADVPTVGRPSVEVA